MPGSRSRREFIAASGAAGLALAAGCLGTLGADGRGASLDAEASAQFRGGLRRQGVYPDASIPAEPAVEWVVRDVNTGDHTAAKASPVATPDGDVVIPGDSGVLRRVTPAGEVVWATRLTTASRGMHGTPAIANGTVYIGAYDGACYAVDLETGERAWRRRLGDAIGSSPGYHEGQLYLAVEHRGPDGSLFALDAATGRPTWVDNRPTDHPHSTCAIDRAAGRLLVGSNDGTLYAWSYPGLEFVWSFETGRPIKGPVATGAGTAFFGSWDGTAYAVALDDGSETWSFDADGLVMSGPAIERSSGTVYLGSHDTTLYALDLESGAVRWRFESGGRLIGCPTVTAEHVLVGSYDGHLYAVGKATGEPAWRVEGVGRVTSTPLVLDGAVYFADRASKAHLQGEGGPTGGLYKVGPGA
ncbi:MAG: PQQ-binding-like beta-propeller repeat protein [Halobacteriales archaeon]|nr:PQQ-binding-like beta-propeller repeat protein [Halobacteriales archaeon]